MLNTSSTSGSFTALVFPGQGSQRPGMAKDFHEAFPVAREVFEEAGDAISLDMKRLCFEENAELDLTEFTQPAILTAEMAMYRVLTSQFGLRASFFGGHSLGEYVALCAAGAIPLRDAVKLVRLRGGLMQRAVPSGRGAMAAVISPGIAARDLTPELARLDVEVANRNSTDQVVLSGSTEGIATATRRLEEVLKGPSDRVTALNVSAPFHSALMKGIEPEFASALNEVSSSFDLHSVQRVTSNFTGVFHLADKARFLQSLTRQISGTVNWISNMEQLTASSERIYEVGPNRPLRAFFKTLGREITSIISLKAAEKELR